MKAPEVECAERQALAQPRDYPQDFDRPTTWCICGNCLRPFVGLVERTLCRVCSGGVDGRTA